MSNGPLMNLSPELKIYHHATHAWLAALERVTKSGKEVAPRGLPCVEVLHATTVVAMTHPVVAVTDRKLSYSFAAAEALAILTGDARVAALAPYAPRVADFSDDGKSFSGAYGPPVVEQLPFVLGVLGKDRDTRQAWLTIWRPSPPPSKDIPCTIGLGFSVRRGWLNCHAYMRSSDVWLGLPYDVFNFSMIAAYVACRFNMQNAGEPVSLGYLCLTAASSHLYQVNAADADRVLSDATVLRTEPVPEAAIRAGDWGALEGALVACREKTEAAVRPAWRVRPLEVA